MNISIVKYSILAALVVMVALPVSADNRKKKRDVQPDSIPVANVPVVEKDTMPVVAEYVDSLIVENENSGVRYNINTVEMQDTSTWVGRMQWQLDSLSNTGIFETTQLGLYVYDITDDKDLFAVNHLQRMRPASCQKLVTSISALHYLGGNYQLRTDLRLTGEIKDSVLLGDVYVVGRMDPVLAQGDVYQMALALQKEGIDSIAGHIYFDTTFKDDKALGWGWCWDDKWGPMNVLTVDGKDRFDSEFLSDLKEVGISYAHQDTILFAAVPQQSRLIRQNTHSIDQVLTRMMKNSNNIYAESLFYQLAARSGAKGAGRKQAVQYIDKLITSLGLKASRYQVADGSGLSLYNYVTPELLVRLLTHAWKNENIRTHLYPSLPIAGQDGTLSKRMRNTAAYGNVRAKTGTVEGISSLSGYATAQNGHILAFSIINQGIIYTSTGKDFQDKVCKVLCE